MTPVSDERLAELISYLKAHPPTWKNEHAAAEALQELQAFRAERTRQMQEG